MIGLAFVLSACGGTYLPPPSTGSGGEVKVGKPYKIGGNWYSPADDPYYDEVGMASWYGRDFHGKKTANGERYDMNALTAAHTTLPMPSYVRVTNLSNGRSIVVRVNDRGPFAKGRIIDMSRRGAQLLGFASKGVERVRVQRVRPDGTPFVRYAEDRPPQPVVSQPVRGASTGNGSAPAAGHMYVQLGSYTSSETARGLVGKLRGLGPVLIQAAVVNGQTVWRLRIGPFLETALAYSILEAARERGFADARVFTEPVG